MRIDIHHMLDCRRVLHRPQEGHRLGSGPPENYRPFFNARFHDATPVADLAAKRVVKLETMPADFFDRFLFRRASP